MFLLTSLNLLLDGRRNDAGGPRNTESGTFPAGRLTSAAWEGWWHEDAA